MRFWAAIYRSLFGIRIRAESIHVADLEREEAYLLAAQAAIERALLCNTERLRRARQGREDLIARRNGVGGRRGLERRPC